MHQVGGRFFGDSIRFYRLLPPDVFPVGDCRGELLFALFMASDRDALRHGSNGYSEAPRSAQSTFFQIGIVLF